MTIKFEKNNHFYLLNENTIHDSAVKFNLLAGRRIVLESQDGSHHKETFIPTELREIISNSGIEQGRKSHLLSLVNTRGYVKIEGKDSELSKENFIIRFLSYLRHLGAVVEPINPKEIKDFNALSDLLKKDDANSLEVKKYISETINEKLQINYLNPSSVWLENDAIRIHFPDDLHHIYPTMQKNFITDFAEYDIDRGFDIRLNQGNWLLFQDFLKSRL